MAVAVHLVTAMCYWLDNCSIGIGESPQGINTHSQVNWNPARVRFMKIKRAHCLVVVNRVLFGVVVSQVLASRGPMIVELLLGLTVTEPMEPHVHCFGADLFAGAFGNGNGSGIVSLNGSGLLWMAHVFQGNPNGDGFCGSNVEGSCFSFSRRGQDIFLDFGNGMDSSIVGDIFGGEQNT